MCKKSLSERQKVTDISFIETDPEKAVEKAASWAKALWMRAGQLYGDKEDTAMHIAAGWAKVPPGVFWKLRYRKPREIGASIYCRLMVAHHEHITSVEGKVAENLIALRALSTTEADRGLVAHMEKYLGLAPGEAPAATARETVGDD